MTATLTKPHAPSTPSLERVSVLMASDMQAVNGRILGRVQSEVPLITDIAKHIIASGGKRIRPLLTLICSRMCGAEGEWPAHLAAAVEFIHTATLLHDDVVDASKLRRGLDTANEVFGNKASVLVGDFLLSQAFQMMVEGGLEVLRILSDASAIIAKGEVMQLATVGQPETSQAEYLAVISSKTAALFAAACALGAVAGGKMEQEKTLHDFGLNLGIAFQLVDDALDYAADERQLGKTVGDDFREGKVTLPVIVAYRQGSAEEKKFWMRAMSGEQRAEDFAQAQALLIKHDAMAATFALAREYCDDARARLSSFGPGQYKNALLEIVDFCEARGY